MKNIDILKLNGSLKELSKETAKIALKFAVARNLQILAPVVEALQKARDGSDIEGAADFFRCRKAILDRGSDALETSHDLKALEAQYSDTVAKLSEREAEYKALLDSESEVSLISLNLSDFPAETKIDLTNLLPVIKET